AFEGAKTHYDSMTAELEQRINFELDVIKKMGFPGYFLIVQDFINSARKLGVAVGPGRGSAAGSVVAFCTGITNIDPIKYNLLFERFLNPERVSMPDIDIDFDDQGRAKVIDYVVEKYGRNQVAQIVTYGTMAAKMSIKDVARVMDLPLDESNKLAKLVPEKAGTTLKKAFEESAELEEIRKGKDLRAKILQNAQVLEGSVRGTGIHAAGVIIAPDNIMNYIPVCISKDSDLWVTQFDGKVIEEAGMLKMDFLGLKTLTIIRDALALIKKNYGIDINIDKIPLEDKKTFELYQRGDTVGTFQFESDGMRKYLKELKPTNIEDLIAMNALYRPGPLAFIPIYIERKHGRETVEYAHPLLKQILEPTFGIMIYQEQIMQTAQLLAGYTLGGADLLRRAMGKKKKEEMEKQRAIFVKGALEKNNIPEEKAGEIFSVMEKFAEYGFNRSHSAAYSVVAYQTAYLKANYTAEYMAAVMTHSMGTIEKITFFMDECKRIGVQVLGPDINESSMAFDVNKKNQIRFGMGAVKGTGDAAVEEIIKERNEKGIFASIYDFSERVNLKTVSKKTFESLAYSGAFDCFPDLHRAQYFHIVREGESTGIEKIIRYGTNKQANKGKLQVSMFGGSAASAEEDKPKISECSRWSELEKLKHEKDVVGFYISGHPLEDFRGYLNKFCSCVLNQLENYKNQEVKVGGVITAVTIKQGRDNTQFALFTIEDFDKSVSLALFNDYPKYKDLLQIDNFVIVKGKVLERNGNWELRPNSLELLTKEMQEGSVKQVSLQIDLQKLNSENLSALEKLVQNHAGNCDLRLQIIDPQNRQTIDKISRKYKIKPTSELLAGLKQLEMEYKVE
ncbi:MAG: DNA polymerase III subunit alpha, partial [Bacteroidetes bacterium]